MNDRVSEVVIENVNLNNATPQIELWRGYTQRQYRPSDSSYRRINKLIKNNSLVVEDVYVGIGGICLRCWVNV